MPDHPFEPIETFELREDSDDSGTWEDRGGPDSWNPKDLLGRADPPPPRVTGLRDRGLLAQGGMGEVRRVTERL